MSGPTAMPRPKPMLMRLICRPSLPLVARSATTAKAGAAIPAEASPWTRRAPISCDDDVAKPNQAVAGAIRKNPAMINGLRPRRSDKRPNGTWKKNRLTV
jgi:hypothetical protein